ncbi:DUF6382 domain-containing protein [Paenibacillus sp. YIM B09110]|uniref:DUF6382 domain-containing protein n=1 Tax=Paenibacillus sp. YIM B09110 TaxID=3126102 RepID=UPI00301C5CBD
MQKFRIDFSMNRGHEMLIDTEDGIQRSSLDDIELHMLRGEKIPYLLPVDWFELDGMVTFRYVLDGYKMLLHRLQLGTLTMQQYYSLVLGLIDALSECRHYMLRPEGCLLDESFIFIGEQLHDVRLAYVPIQVSDNEAATSSELMSLIVRWTSYVDVLDGEGLKRILRQLSSNKWPLAELRTTVLELIGGSSAVGHHPRIAQTILRPPQYEEQEYASGETRSRQEVVFQEQARPMPPQLSERLHIRMDTEDEELFTQQQIANVNKFKWIAAAITLLAAACIWRFVYLASPSNQSMLISVAMMLLLAAVVIVVWKRNVRISIESEDMDLNLDQESAYDETGAASEFEALSQPQTLHNRYNHLLSASTGDSQVNRSDTAEATNHLPMKPGATKTGLLEKIATPGMEPTVLLGKSQKETKVELAAKLYRRWQGEDNVIEWAEPMLRIGRAGDQGGYEELASGISRMHLEFMYSEGERVAKDLGSSNGSTLNGEPMIPYKAYKITDGDRIQLAGANGPMYEFRLE